MSPLQLEARVIGIVNAALKGHQCEDSTVEIKAQWIDVGRAARRLAGAANAARGAPVLLIVGLDEGGRSVVGAIESRWADWFQSLSARFDGPAPRVVVDRVIHVADSTVFVAVFDTSSAPYVVKNPTYGVAQGETAESEIPWREATRVRTIRRSELIELLAGAQKAPLITPLQATCETQRGIHRVFISRDGDVVDDKIHLDVSASMYIEATTSETCIMPNHRCSVRLALTPIVSLTETTWELRTKRFSNSPHETHANEGRSTVLVTPGEVTVSGCGLVELVATFHAPPDLDFSALTPELRLTLAGMRSDWSRTISWHMHEAHIGNLRRRSDQLWVADAGTLVQP